MSNNSHKCHACILKNNKTCSKCKEDKPKPDYHDAEWDKKRARRQCKACKRKRRMMEGVAGGQVKKQRAADKPKSRHKRKHR